jgi:ABC-type enterochelin transport system substrate-binding protein
LIVLQFKKVMKMKKLVFVFAAMVAVAFASCGNKAANAEAADADSIAVEEATEVVVEEAPADSVVADSAAVEVVAE